MKGKFYGVSVGPGDPEYMTLKAVRALERCPVVVAPRTDSRNNVALDIARAAADLTNKELLYVDIIMCRDRAKVEACYDGIAARVTERLDRGQDVAMLCLGDASLYASQSNIRRRVAAAGYETETVAGVTSFCACAARLGVSLTSPRLPLRILPGDYPELAAELAAPGTCVIMKSGRELAGVKRLIRNAGLHDRARMVVNCGMPDEAVYHDIELAQGGYFSTILIGGETEL